MVLMLFTCGKCSGTVPVVDDNVNTCNPPTVSTFVSFQRIFSALRYYRLLLLRTPNPGPEGVRNSEN